MRILIIGAGGHGQVVADILLWMKISGEGIDPIGYLDDNRDLNGRCFLGLPVLGVLEQIKNTPHDFAIIAIGDNQTRAKIFSDLVFQGEALAIARHPKAIIAHDVCIGSGTMICAGVVVNPCTTIGSNVILNTGSTIDHHNIIENHVHIGPGARLGGEAHIGSGSLIGIGATVMPGRHVGSGCIVGAGALVHKDVPDRSTVIGVPGRIVKTARI
jgi:sugar O-acyltransferase (sialic acid O-acetyltransferase NeuD family)